MPVEPVSCRKCSRKFSPKLALCPFCNAAREPGERERCPECGKDRAPGLTACPFCHPDKVAPATRSAVQGASTADAVRRAIDATSASPLDDEPWVSRKMVLVSGIATAVTLTGALACGRYYDRIGPDAIGSIARALGLLPVVFLGAWLRRAWRNGSIGFSRLRSMVVAYVLIVLPSALGIYALALLLNGWTADATVDALCTMDSAGGGTTHIACQTGPTANLRGEVRTALLRTRVPSSQAFVASLRRGGLGVWLIDVGSARELGPGDPRPRLWEPERPLLQGTILAPDMPFPGVRDEDPRPPRRAPDGQ